MKDFLVIVIPVFLGIMLGSVLGDVVVSYRKRGRTITILQSMLVEADRVIASLNAQLIDIIDAMNNLPPESTSTLTGAKKKLIQQPPPSPITPGRGGLDEEKWKCG